MKDACSGGSENDDFAEKGYSIPANQINGNRPNENEENSQSKVEGTLSESTSVDKGSCSNQNDDSEIIILKEEKKQKTDDRNRVLQAGRRSSTRLQGKRPKLTEIITTSDEEENLESDNDCFEEKEEKRSRGKKLSWAKETKHDFISAKKKSEPKSYSKSPTKERKGKKSNEAASKLPKEFSSGSFVVLKSDFHSTMTPPLWRIDGKALLQKYVHFDQQGQTLYKNTSTYSGWTTSNRDQYYPAEVEIKSHTRKDTIVKFNKETIVADDSD